MGGFIVETLQHYVQDFHTVLLHAKKHLKNDPKD